MIEYYGFSSKDETLCLNNKKVNTLARKIILIIFAIISFTFTFACAAPHAVAASPKKTLSYLVEKKNLPIDASIAKATGFARDEMLCLALNIYHEARGSTVKNKLAVGFVTFNRLHLPDFPRTICDVVFQHTTRVVKRENNNGVVYDAKVKIAQFSWITKDLEDIFPQEDDEWTQIQRLASFLYTNQGRFEDFTNGATHFYAPKVLAKLNLPKPAWVNRGLDKRHIGDHVYMRLASFNK